MGYDTDVLIFVNDWRSFDDNDRSLAISYTTKAFSDRWNGSRFIHIPDLNLYFFSSRKIGYQAFWDDSEGFISDFKGLQFPEGAEIELFLRGENSKHWSVVPLKNEEFACCHEAKLKAEEIRDKAEAEAEKQRQMFNRLQSSYSQDLLKKIQENNKQWEEEIMKLKMSQCEVVK